MSGGRGINPTEFHVMRVSTSVILITVIAAGVVVASVAPIFAGPQAASAPDGTAVIEATAAAYREAPALTDTVRIRVEQPGGSE
jgi:hypothetical protein